MGCGSSQDDVKENPIKVTSLHDTRFSHQSMVTEKRSKIRNDYDLLQPPLGKGAFGEVYKGKHKVTGQLRAVKLIKKKAMSIEQQEMLIQEVEILKQLDHPNIITIYEFYQDNNFFYIVTELCQGGELFDRIVDEKFFSEKKAAEIMKEILSAVTYCHQRNIVHRDLKPENVLYETLSAKSGIKVADFGTGYSFDPNQKMEQRVGTPYYIAPEVIDRKYTEKCDVWSCGVIMFILLCGFPPFNGEDDYEIMAAVRKGEYQFSEDEWKNVSSEAKTLISRMLQKDQRKRISANEALNDPWIKTYCNKQEVDLPQLAKTLTNMKNFRTEKKLQEAAMLFIVNFLTTKEEKTELLTQFKALDLNNDGRLSKEELIIGYNSVLGELNAEQRVEQIMKELDKDGSGGIDYSEFVLATISTEKLLATEKLVMAFKMIDKDNSGHISKEEIKQVFGQCSGIHDNVWKEMIEEVDINSDGKISFDEFKQMMLKVVKA